MESYLSSCEREPIQFLGAIQSIGAVVVFDLKQYQPVAVGGTIPWLKVSRDVPIWQGVPLGFRGQVEQLLTSIDTTRDSVPGLRLEIDKQAWFLHVHPSSPGFGILEIEAAPAAPFTVSQMTAQINHLIFAAGSDDNSLFFMEVAQVFQELLGYGRVLVYELHPDNHGEVVGEALAEEYQSYWGLHFPASDIPAQARALYEKNPVRIIVDAQASPVVLKELGHAPVETIDLTWSHHRSVSAVHRTYLKNMGVVGSMSVSLFTEDGKLWGLIACHDTKPRLVDYETRECSKVLGQLVSTLIGARRRRIVQHAGVASLATVETLIAQATQSKGFGEGLIGARSIAELIPSTGWAAGVGNDIVRGGDVPPIEVVGSLLAIAQKCPGGVLEVTSLKSDERIKGLVDYFPPTVAGFYMVSLVMDDIAFLLWCRPELIQTVKWAGKPVEFNEAGYEPAELRPQRSFQEWSQQVRHRCLPWRDQDREAAESLRRRLTELWLSKSSEQLRDAVSLLQESNERLEGVLHTAIQEAQSGVEEIRQKLNSLVSYFHRDQDPAVQQALLRSIESTTVIEATFDQLVLAEKVVPGREAIGAVDVASYLREAAVAVAGQLLRTDQIRLEIPKSIPLVAVQPKVFKGICLALVRFVASSKVLGETVRIELHQQTDKQIVLRFSEASLSVLSGSARPIDTILRKLKSRELALLILLIGQRIANQGGKMWFQTEADGVTSAMVELLLADRTEAPV